ncbi:MAG: RDD family protein [Chitinophagaceae bacterium]
MPPETDLLQEFEAEYEEASVGQRFGNYIIDLVSFYILIIGGGALVVMTTQSDSLIRILDSIPSILDRLLTLIVFGLYVLIIEGITKGRTLGKIITGTRAIRDDGAAFNWGDAFGRGFSRMVPFEPFSGFSGYPWHDKWTNTRVVKVKK